jgi:hypothetical protein
MLALLKLALVAVFILSAIAAFHKWLDHIEQRRVVVTWSRFFLWLWLLASAAWVGPLILLTVLHGDFSRAPLLSLQLILVRGVVPSLVALAVGHAVARTRRGFRSRASDPAP